ncbi:MarR family transcriptional regulator [Streptomyces sp. NBC_01218]|uniref:MarR family winged helix-turn-helix transcriptional regulator n=1 Tax=unclassified Streptomyces TaxID=2593676 RepID=UPI0023B99D48|nr:MULTISPECIES: MarR family transcriptional regulator [unclassified Streptomyces]WEH40344.1 MarR family transcriptional regulator [Streptomyces sp. AM 2-1-1]WSQ52036.1 MarR family transcriptional regulator [Streptomyces sp. NBC_01218]
MFPRRPPSPQELARTASEVTDLLAVLGGRAQANAPTGPTSPSQLRALLAIERREGGNMRSLGEALGSTPPATSRLCDRLEAAGLIERRLSPASRREIELYLSRPGRALLEEIRAGQVREVSLVLAAMDPEAAEALHKGLAAFRDAAEDAIDGDRYERVAPARLANPA